MRFASSILVILFTLFHSCESNSDQKVYLNPGELFSYDLNVYGDEEGARITEQARHYSQSDIIRDSTTAWGAFYFYRSNPNYKGPDYVTIETCAGGRGSSCDEYTTIEFEFQIKD